MQRNLTILALFALILVLIARTCGGPAEPAPAVTPTEVIIEPTETVDTPTEESVRELTPTPAATETTEPATTEPEPTLEPTVEIIPTLTSEPEASLIEEADWEPQVVSSSPALGEEVTLNGAITIRFDQAMDQASVEEAFSIDGDIDGAFVWTRADEVTFTPAGQLERQQEYQVQIAASARSVNGKALREPLSLHFQTIGALEVSQIIPADGTADVSADATITILFNRPVVPLVSTGQQADLVQPLTFLPAIAGEGEWVNTSIYRFTPTDPLLAATTYDVGIVDGLQDVTGNEMVQTFDASFRTVAPQVVLINEGVQDEIAPDQTISVTFNMPMSQPETQAVIEWKPPVAVTYNWSADGRTVGVTPVERMQLDTNYTLFVGEFAMAAKGRAEMGSPTLAQFTTFPFPAVSGTAPNPGEVIDGDGLTYWRGISFNFETPMNRDTVLNDLIIEPAPVDPTYSGADLRYYVDFAFEYETVYRVTVPATAQDIYGNEMGEAYVFEFETGSAPPVGAFNLPPVLTQLSRSFPSNVNFIYRNIESASIRLEQFETLPLDQLTGSFHYYYNGDKNGAVGETVREWSFEYEPATAGATEIALADGSALPNGVYRLVASSPQLTQENSGWQNQDVLLVIGETNLTIKETPETVHVWATDLDSGQPVAGRDLTFFYRSRDVVRSFATAATDENGFASVSKAFSESDSDRYSYDNILVQTGEPGEFGFGLASTGWNTGVRSWDLNVSARSSPERSQSMVLYTDRPLYRPGDTVHVRGWVRDNNFGRYTIPTPDTIELSLRSPDYNNEPLDLTFDLDENGGFYGEWVIPEDAMLGGWVFNVDMERFDGKADRSIVVAEFRKPEYLVEVTPSEPEALRGEDVEMVVSAEYFFGGAAAGLPIEYTIYANPYNEPIERSAYQFSNRAYSPYSYYGGGGYGFGNYVNSGYGETDAAGNYIIKIPNRLLDEQDAGGLRLSVEAKIVDTTGLAVTGNGELLLHPAAVYVGSKPQQYVSDVNSGVVIDVITVDWNGETVAEQSVEVVFAKRDWKAMPHDFDPGRVKWEAVDNEVAQVSLTTDANGQVVASFAPEAGGIYVAISTVTDANGRTHTNNTTIYVWGDETTWRFDQQERQMSLTASEDQLNVGDSAEILVQAPFAGMRAWLMIERGELIEQRLITLDGTSEVLTLDMLPEHAPNVFVSLAAVKGADESERPVADIRYGVVELQIDPERLLLDVEITPDQTIVGPRDEVTYQIKTTNYLGEGVSAELSLALVDLAVLTLKEDPAIPLAESFYAPQPMRSQIGAGLFVSGEGLEVMIPVLSGGSGGGGGGGAVAESAVALDREAEVDENGEIRDDFRDLAHWEARVTTDENGEATVTVTLPDNLTTWRMNAKAVSVDTLVGEASNDIIATRQLLIRPVTPRFLTFGDRVQMTAVVNNNSTNDIEATVSLEAEGVTLDGDAEQIVSVPAGGSTLVRWPVTVQDAETVDLIFRVEGGGLRDASRPIVGEIPVYRYNAEDIVATAGMLGDETRRVEAVLLPPLVDTDAGSLSVNLSPSLAAAIIDALDASSTLNYDSNCAYSLAYRLLPNASSAEMIRTLNLDKPDLLVTLDAQNEQFIEALVGLRRADGGWDYCDQDESKPWMTAFALHGLAVARQAGYAVDEASLGESISYLLEYAERIEVDSAESATKKAYYYYIGSLLGRDELSALEQLLADGRDLLPAHGLAMIAMAFDNLDADVPATVLSDSANSAVLNATGAHWEGGAALSFNSDVRVTAVVVNALAQVEPDNALLPNAVRWLMGARSGRYWSSAQDTSWTIAALNAWMQASGELEADYNYTLHVNESLLADDRFAAENISSSELINIPIAELSTIDINFLDIQKQGDGNLYYTAYLDALISADSVDAVDRGFAVERAYYDAACDAECQPITSIASGQEVRVELTILVKDNRRFVRIEDPLPAGVDAIDPDLDTSGVGSGVDFGRTEYTRGYWGWWYFNRIEFRDEKVVFTSDYLPAGIYQYSYHIQPIVPGEYQVMPTLAKEEFQPAVFGRSQGLLFTITE